MSVVAIIGGFALGLAACALPGDASSPNTPRTAPDPSATPSASAVSLPALTGATLGGVDDAIYKAYPTNVYPSVQTTADGSLSYDTYMNGAQVILTLTNARGVDGQSHIAQIELDLIPRQSDDFNDVTLMLLALLPPDAQKSGDRVRLDNGAQASVWTSQRLAATLPASAFVSADTHQPVQPGTLNWWCTVQGVDQPHQCFLQPGRP